MNEKEATERALRGREETKGRENRCLRDSLNIDYTNGNTFER